MATVTSSVHVEGGAPPRARSMTLEAAGSLQGGALLLLLLRRVGARGGRSLAVRHRRDGGGPVVAAAAATSAASVSVVAERALETRPLVVREQCTHTEARLLLLVRLWARRLGQYPFARFNDELLLLAAQDARPYHLAHKWRCTALEITGFLH